jgi:hypothetical protein
VLIAIVNLVDQQVDPVVVLLASLHPYLALLDLALFQVLPVVLVLPDGL